MRAAYRTIGLCLAFAVALACGESTAQNYPTKPIRFMVGYAPGGSNDILARIVAPTLILAGRHDWICPPEFSEEIHRLVPGSDLRIFEESSHSIRADEPRRMIDAIAGFVACNAR